MATIEGVGRVGQPAPAGRGGARVAGPGFQVAARQPPAAAAAAPAAEVSLAGMLALQEMEEGEVRDRAARRRGQDLLAQLAGLQRALLAASGPGAAEASAGAALHRLSTLAEAVPQAADPRLRQAVAAIVLRSRVELARYEHDNSENITPLPR